ncbi:uncharacterized protein LOC141618337 isoform X1 [Silene latifolia]|uniref:uncharacterized protein LOC141618337 isoform X1 n=1 Tax=Silene latifolia TaxID=37657 RepID=UPI003D770DA3
MEPNSLNGENSDKRIYVGNVDHRISEATLIKMFSPFGKIESEDFLLHTRGPKRGEPRGFAFVQYSTKEEAILAKEKMHGRLACGRPLVVRLASEKAVIDTSQNLSKGSGVVISSRSGSTSGQMSRSAKIAAIKNKLKTLEENDSRSAKKQKQLEGSSP